MMGRKTSLTLANMAVGTVLGVVAGKVSALYFGSQFLGQVFYSMGLLGLAFFITDLGMGSAHIKRVSEGRDPGDCFATFAVFKTVATALFVMGSTGVLALYLFVYGGTIESTTIPVFFLVLLYYVSKSLQEIGQSSFDARMETARSQLSLFVDTLVRVVLTIAAAFAFASVVHGTGPLASRLDPDNALLAWVAAEPGAAFALAYALGAVAAATASLVMLYRVFERGRFRWALLKDYASFAFPLFLSSAITIISANVDAAALGFFLGDTEAGVFGAIRRISGVLMGLGIAVGALLFPTISGLVARGEHAEVQRKMDQSIRYLSMLVVPVAAFLAWFSEDIIHLLLSDQFISGAPALSLLSLWVVLMTLAGPHGNLVLGIGKPQVVARIGIATATVLIVLNLVLVPDDLRSLGIRLAGLGVTGAALATLVSGALWYFGMRTASARLAGYRERGHVVKHVFAAVVMIGALALLDASLLPLERIYHVAVYAAVGAAAYFLVLLPLGEFTREDVGYFRDAVHPIEMLRYMRQELSSRRR